MFHPPSSAYNRPMVLTTVLASAVTMGGVLAGITMTAPLGEWMTLVDVSDWLNGSVLLILFVMCFLMLRTPQTPSAPNL